MTIQLANIGNSANDGTGDNLRDAFVKFNSNFSEIDTYSIANVGAGAQIFKSKSNGVESLRSIVAGHGITVTQGTNDITISGGAGRFNEPLSFDHAGITPNVTTWLEFLAFNNIIDYGTFINPTQMTTDFGNLG